MYSTELYLSQISFFSFSPHGTREFIFYPFPNFTSKYGFIFPTICLIKLEKYVLALESI